LPYPGSIVFVSLSRKNEDPGNDVEREDRIPGEHSLQRFVLYRG